MPTPPPQSPSRVDRVTISTSGVHPSALVLPVEGQHISDRYKLRTCLGEGGMGMVFLAADLRLERDVVVKVIHPRIANDTTLRRMFSREAKSMAELRHPNVVEIYDIGEDDGLLYFVMPYLPGTNLSQWCALRNGPPIEPHVAVDILGQACSGIMAMHAKGLLHSDIKPNNILVSDSLEVRIADLGLACRISDREPSIDIGGTPGYIAPELARNAQTPSYLAPRADVYALGATAYWLLTGRVPTRSIDPLGSPPRPGVSQIPSPSTVQHDLSPAYDALILRALDVNPASRLDVKGFRHALFQVRNSLTRVSARHPRSL